MIVVIVVVGVMGIVGGDGDCACAHVSGGGALLRPHCCQIYTCMSSTFGIDATL